VELVEKLAKFPNSPLVKWLVLTADMVGEADGAETGELEYNGKEAKSWNVSSSTCELLFGVHFGKISSSLVGVSGRVKEVSAILSGSTVTRLKLSSWKYQH